MVITLLSYEAHEARMCNSALIRERGEYIKTMNDHLKRADNEITALKYRIQKDNVFYQFEDYMRPKIKFLKKKFNNFIEKVRGNNENA